MEEDKGSQYASQRSSDAEFEEARSDDDDRSDVSRPHMDVDPIADSSRTVFMSSPISHVEVVQATHAHVAPSSASGATSVATPGEIHNDDFITAPAEEEQEDYGYGFSF